MTIKDTRKVGKIKNRQFACQLIAYVMGLLIALTICIVISKPAVAQEVIIQEGHNNQGWQFYSEIIPDPALKAVIEKAHSGNGKVSSKKTDPYPYTTAMEDLRKSFAEIQNRYLLNPTQDNTIAWQKSIIAVEKMGQRAALARVKMLLTHPELSYRASNPTESNARQIANIRHLDKQKQMTREIAKTHVMLFFYDAADQNAESLAPSIAQFADDYGFTFKGMPLTNQTLSAIKDNSNHPISNLNLAHKLGVTVFPAIVLVNPVAGTAQPVAYGYISTNELLEMLYMIGTNYSTEDVFND